MMPRNNQRRLVRELRRCMGPIRVSPLCGWREGRALHAVVSRRTSLASSFECHLHNCSPQFGRDLGPAVDDYLEARIDFSLEKQARNKLAGTRASRGLTA